MTEHHPDDEQGVERYPAKVRAALEVLMELCGGEDYCKVVRESNAAIVVHAYSSDAFGGFDVEISYDGCVKRVEIGGK